MPRPARCSCSPPRAAGELLPADVRIGRRFRGTPASFPAETLRRRRSSCRRVPPRRAANGRVGR
ncbi:hypothetical protein PAHAL_6G294600 [Panicum hallii]|uniref:Uncharacterized protein n=1 Tax=Panicum hallii TaxID=206008 RepID=A0A2S3I3Q9_9POAL|nr:hypothetical protein PAHAL_6G294600 [Panicum hallii]